MQCAQEQGNCGSPSAGGGGKEETCACLTDPTQRTTQCGTAGASGSGGATGSGGSSSANGGTSSGGTSSGGTSAAGGTTSGGGGTQSGGASNSGGATGNGGVTGNGGSGGAGGTTTASSGGTMGSGGAASGGSTGTGGGSGDPYCGPPFVSAVPSGYQGVTVAPDTPSTCSACEQDPLHCPHDPDGCAAGTCDAQPACSDYPTQAEQSQCMAVQRCVRQTSCASDGVTSCFCGNTDINSCTGSLSGPKGACKDEIIAGFPQGTSAAQMLGSLTDVSSPSGGAMSLAQCDTDDAVCKSECGAYCK
ncbi:MAG TPA: hypothetical protein VHC69_11935 [Polyangiaceae bacterium]|nr:hypothetical protein [Polyangiaceae bacterium]